MHLEYADPQTYPSGFTGYGLEGFSLKKLLKKAAPLVAAVAPIAGGVVGSIVPGVGTVIGGMIGGVVGNLAQGLIPQDKAAAAAGMPFDDLAPLFGQPAGTAGFGVPIGSRVWVVPTSSPYKPPAIRAPKNAPNGAALWATVGPVAFNEATLPNGTRTTKTPQGSSVYFVPAPAARPAGSPPAGQAAAAGGMDSGTMLLLGGLALAAVMMGKRS